VTAANGAGLGSAATDPEARKVVQTGESSQTSKPKSKSSQQSWRDVLPVHPAAELFPMMSESELLELGEDIKKHGLKVPVILWSPSGRDHYLLDGRNRLDAMELVGLPTVYPNGLFMGFSGALNSQSVTKDPYAYVISANIQRRHLSTEQKRELIAKVLRARPEQSNRQIAKQVKADDKTVAKVRAELESTAEIPQLDKTVGADGKARKKPATKAKSAAHDTGGNGSDPEASAEAMKAAHTAAEDADAEKESGGEFLNDEPHHKPPSRKQLKAFLPLLDDIERVASHLRELIGDDEWIVSFLSKFIPDHRVGGIEEAFETILQFRRGLSLGARLAPTDADYEAIGEKPLKYASLRTSEHIGIYKRARAAAVKRLNATAPVNESTAAG
jgi:hypothetical protein